MHRFFKHTKIPSILILTVLSLVLVFPSKTYSITLTPQIAHIVITGQSLSIGFKGTPVLSTTQPYNNLRIKDDKSDFEPLVEAVRNISNDFPISAGETTASSMANGVSAKINYNAYQISANTYGVGDTKYEFLKKGSTTGASYAKSIDGVIAAKALAQKRNLPFSVPAVVVIHGESDQRDGNGPQYENYLVEWQQNYDADIRAITGQSNTVMMMTDQMGTLVSATPVDVALKQLAASEDYPDKFLLVTPKYFFQYSDGIHLTNTSYRWLGEYYAKVYKKVFIDGQTWKPLSPTSISRTDNIITAKFNVPAGNLVFDTTLVGPKTNYGFEYYNSDNQAAIQKVEISGTDSVKITLNKTPASGTERLRYAYTGTTYAASGPFEAGSLRGNLRDTDNTPSLYGNTLYNWGVHFDKPITNISKYDINKDTKVNAADLSIFLTKYGSTEASDLSKCDFNGNNKVDSADLSLILSNLK